MSITILTNISQCLTLESAFKKDGRNLSPQDLGVIDRPAIVYSDKILWVGKEKDLPSQYQGEKKIDLNSNCLTPGIFDSHTHLVFGGDRSKEYSMRLNGASYEEIAQSGGGILSTMNATRQLSREKLFELAKTRINRMKSYGVKGIEIKSGYGLDYEHEKKLNLIIDDLKKFFSDEIMIHNTFMAAHAIPPEFNSSSDYLDEVVLPLLQELAPLKIIDSVDIFHEQNYFDQADVIKLFEAAKKHSLSCRIHADEFADNGGAKLAAKYSCLSADHLLQSGEEGIEALANSKTVATLLPGTGFFLGKKQANSLKMLRAGVKLALASDFNPGSCHYDNILQIAAQAAPTLGLNQAQLWSSICLNAAHSLGWNNCGYIAIGAKPIFSSFKASSIDQITYQWGHNLYDPLV